MAVTTTVVPAAVTPAVTAGPIRSVQWGSVILGMLAASAICMVLLTFGAGIGLSATSARPYAGASAKALGVISALYTAVTFVAAFGIGGYVAGRMRIPLTEELAESDFRDGAHGFAVWALTIFVGGLLAMSSVGGALKTVIQSGAAVAGGAAAGAASNPALASLTTTPTDYAIDSVLAPAPIAAPAAPAPAPAPATPPAGGTTTDTTATPAPAPMPRPAAAPMAPPSRADMTAPINRIFAASLKSGQLAPNDRATLVTIVQQQTGLPRADAEKRVDDAYAQLKTAEQKARDAAEAARKAALITAFAVAATLLLGCAAACAAASAGAHHRAEKVAVAFFGSRRFW